MSDPVESAVSALNAFGIDGMRPFDTSADDLAQTSADQAYALLHVLSSGWNASEDSPNADCLSALNPEIHSMALDGIARLVALSKFAMEAAR